MTGLSQESGPRVDPLEARIARLSKGQLDCLRLVDQHYSSKEIAGELNISPHTVDQRIRQALQFSASSGEARLPASSPATAAHISD